MYSGKLTKLPELVSVNAQPKSDRTFFFVMSTKAFHRNRAFFVDAVGAAYPQGFSKESQLLTTGKQCGRGWGGAGDGLL